MKTLHILLNILLISQSNDGFLTTKQHLSCDSLTRIDTISYLYYKSIAFVLTSNGYYFVISEDDVNNDAIKQFKPSGKIPYLADCCDAALIKDINECEIEADNKHSIDLIKLNSGALNYISFNISSLFDDSDDKSKQWSHNVMPFTSDIILSNADVDHRKPIDAIFSTDNVGEIFFIQGEYYSGIEFQETSCPQSRDQLIVYNKRSLSELNVEGKIDSAYYDPKHGLDDHPVLYLTNYNNMQYYRVVIDSFNSEGGKLVSLKTTTEQLSSHPIFSRICAPNGHNISAQLSAQDLITGFSLNISSIVYYNKYLNIFMSFIFWYILP